MSSVLPGFEVDIFVSYRHNDNKYDGWVTEFVAKLQQELNATIKDKFYGAASAQPRRVFPLLDRGSANHLSKVGKLRPGLKVNLERALGGILDRMEPDGDPFPASLTAIEQALFSLGYYHQRSEFFRKTDVAGTEEAATS